MTCGGFAAVGVGNDVATNRCNLFFGLINPSVGQRISYVTFPGHVHGVDGLRPRPVVATVIAGGGLGVAKVRRPAGTVGHDCFSIKWRDWVNV